MDIDYNFKIQLFQDITGCYDSDTAMNFLYECDWDEQMAAQLYLASIEANQLANPGKSKGNQVEANSNKNTKSKETENSNNVDINDDVYNNLMSILQLRKESSFNSFKSSIISKMGLLVIYTKTDLDIITDIMFQVSDNENIMELLKANYAIYFIDKDNNDIQPLIQKLKLKGPYPITLFIHDSEMSFLSSSNLIVDKIEGFIEYSFLCDKIKENTYKINKYAPKKQSTNSSGTNNRDNKISVDSNKDESMLSHTELMEKQKKELEEMVNKERQKELQKKIDEENKRKKEDEIKAQREVLHKKLSKEKRDRDIFKTKLYPEPADTEQGKCLIKFRLPNGSIKDRKFLKSWKIEQLYFFINTLENVFVDDDSTDFDILTPFPMKIYDDFDQTLEDAGLGQNSVLQVRER